MSRSAGGPVPARSGRDGTAPAGQQRESGLLPAAHPELFDDPGSAHPALDRFLSLPSDEERLLIIRAPMGTGGPWLAAGWIAAGGLPEAVPDAGRAPSADAARAGPADAAGPAGPATGLYGPEVRSRIIVWDQAGADLDAFVDRVGALLDDPHGGRVAVVGGFEIPVNELAATFPTRLAGPTDVLLTEGEIEAYAVREQDRYRPGLQAHVRGEATGHRSPAGAGGLASKPLTPLQIHVRTGGWLRAVRILLTDPLGSRTARLAIMSSLMRWLGSRSDRDMIETAAFLPEFTEETLEAFRIHPLVGLPGVALSGLQELGLVVPCTDGQWRMPTLVREILQASLTDTDPHRARELIEAAVDATTADAGVESTVETAVRKRSWRRVTELLHDHWIDLYLKNAPALARILERLPRHVLGGLEGTGLASRLVTATRPTGLDYRPSLAPPDYARDELAQRLRARITATPLVANRTTVTYGIADMAHCRLSGHYAEAAEAARRVREIVQEAMDSQRLRPTVAGFAELQAGITLHLADRLVEARSAYEAAYFWGERGEVDFLRADAAGKLALLSAHLGNVRQARLWLGRVDGPLAALPWGRPQVARAAVLAHVHVATADVDNERVHRWLAQLPHEPDADEFWAAHASLIGYSLALQGRMAEAAQRVEEWRRHRPIGSTSPLAERLLREVSRLATLGAGDNGPVPGWEHNPMLANLEAVRCLRNGDFHAALRALRIPERTTLRMRTLAAIIEVIARAQATPETADESVLRQLPVLYRQGGEISDLAYFHPFGWTPVFVRLGMIDEDTAARIAAVTNPAGGRRDAAPRLTAREQEVLRLLREGLTRKQMAESTYRSENTIKGQLRSLYGKLGASTAQEALEAARRFGL